MTASRDLERSVAAWMADETGAAESDRLFGQMLAVATSSRQRPRWLAFLTQGPWRVDSKVVVGSPTYRLALLVVVLSLLLVATFVVAANMPRPAPTADAWPGFRGGPSRSGVAVTGPIGRPLLAWRFQASGSVTEAIAIAGDLVLASSDDGVVHALAIDDGSERWSFHVDTPPAHGPLAVGDRLFVTDGSGSIYALGLDGRQIWQSISTLTGPSDLTIGAGSLYGGSEDGTVAAFRVADGVEQWRTTVSATGGAVHAPSFADGIVVAASDGGELAGFDAATGAIRWKQPVGPGTGTPTIAGGVAYIGSGATRVTAVLRGYDLRSGDPRVTTDEVAYSPTVIDGVGYAGGPLGVVSARDLASGVERWRTPFSGVVRPPVVAGNVLYVAADEERRIYALDLATGEELWHVPVDGSNWCCVAVARGLVVAGTRLGSVYAIGGDGTTVQPTARAAPTATTPTPPPPSDSPTPTSGTIQASVVWSAVAPDADFIPWGLSRDPEGRLWAVEALKDRFAIFDEDGNFIEYWGASGAGEGEFDLTRQNGNPFGMVAFAPDGSFYVLDVGNYRVQRFAADRSFVTEWGSFGTGPGKFADPLSIAVSPDRMVHVLDDQRAVIESYDAEGNVSRTINAYPDAAGKTSGANQVTVGPNGHFYVGLLGPERVIELDAGGTLVATIGGPGAGPSPFHEQPNVMAFDRQGRLYVTQGPARGDDAPGVVVFSSDGRYLGGWGRRGKLEGELGFPWGLVVDVGGDVFVSDAGALPEFGLASRLQRFRVNLSGG